MAIHLRCPNGRGLPFHYNDRSFNDLTNTLEQLFADDSTDRRYDRQSTAIDQGQVVLGIGGHTVPGAFNDNLYKQLVLLLAAPAVGSGRGCTEKRLARLGAVSVFDTVRVVEWLCRLPVGSL